MPSILICLISFAWNRMSALCVCGWPARKRRGSGWEWACRRGYREDTTTSSDISVSRASFLKALAVNGFGRSGAFNTCSLLSLELGHYITFNLPATKHTAHSGCPLLTHSVFYVDNSSCSFLTRSVANSSCSYWIHPVFYVANSSFLTCSIFYVVCQILQFSRAWYLSLTAISIRLRKQLLALANVGE